MQFKTEESFIDTEFAKDEALIEGVVWTRPEKIFSSETLKLFCNKNKNYVR